MQRVRGLEHPDESLGTIRLAVDPADAAAFGGADATGGTLAGAPTWPLWPGAVPHVQSLAA